MLLLINPEPEILNMTKTVTETATDGLLGKPVNKRHLLELIEVALNSRLRGSPTGIGESTVEPDGRKAKRAMRVLVDAGLVTARASTYFVNVDAVLQLVTIIKPTLAIDEYPRSLIIEGRAPVGCLFDKFKQSERLWMLTYPHEYRWFWVARTGEETDWKPGEARPEHSWHLSLYVSDQPLRDELGSAQRATKVAGLMKQNVSWALGKIAKLDKPLIETFMSCGGIGRFGDGDEFSGDSTTWAETAKRYAERAEEKLKKAQAQVDAARDAAAEIAEYGGWDKLGADLLRMVNAKLDSKEDDEEDDKEES